MKALNTILITILLQVTLFAQWEWQNPLPIGNRLKSIFFIDSLNGVAVGSCGDIINTSDGGNSWQANNIGSCKIMHDLFFIDQHIGFATGEGGLLLKTSDSGQSWNDMNSGTTETLNSVHFPDQTNGFIVGNNGTLLRTHDGGDTWLITNISNSTENRLYSVYFINSYIGFTCHYGAILKTTDGGHSWDRIEINDYWFDISFIDDTTGFIGGGSGKILKTIDQGASWSITQLDESSAFKAIHFITTTVGFLVDRYTLFKTTNRGDDWTQLTQPLPVTNIEDYFFFNENNGIAVGEYGRIFNTYDSGITWYPYFEGIQEELEKIFFINQTTGYLASRQSIFKSEDAGNTWIKKFDKGRDLYDMCFSSDSIGYLIKSGDIYKSIDYGETWDSIYTIEGGGGFAIEFIDDHTGFIAGNNRKILKTTNGGIEWTQVNQLGSFSLFSIDMIDSLHGCAVGMISLCYLTTDGGNTWTLNWLYPPEVQFLNVKFYNASIGFAVGYYGEIYKSNNAGWNWQSKISGVTSALLDIYFVDKDTVYVVGDNGVILKSTNQGENWNRMQSPTINRLSSITFIDSTAGLIVGQDGTILNNGSVISGVDYENNQIINGLRFLLTQNYPNPFNPVTKIKYCIPSVGASLMKPVQLKIFDILGRGVATLVNEEKPAGEYEIEFDGSDLPSGIYFYRIKAGDYVETKKMVLLK